MPVVVSTSQTNDRLASLNDVLAFIYKGSDVQPQSDGYTALKYILDGVSRKIEMYCLRSATASWLEQQYTERYGIEDYGRHWRNEIRLRHLPVISITSVTDNLTIGSGSLIDPSAYTVDPNTGILTRYAGKFFAGPRAVEVVYTAGYPSSGSGDSYAILVPVDVRNSCLEQVAYEFSLRQPGGVLYGTSSISRPDGSIVSKAVDLLGQVKSALEPYRLAV